MPFDITDGQNRYAPCPKCGASEGMGLVTKSGLLAVQCGVCGHRGPGIAFGERVLSTHDKAAFDAWNSQEASRG